MELFNIIIISFLVIQQTIALNNKIINGALARDGQFPHMVQIAIKPRDGPTQYCGGSLLDDRWVLTVKKN